MARCVGVLLWVMLSKTYIPSSVMTCWAAVQTVDTVFAGGDDAAMIMATEDVLTLQQEYCQHHQQLVHKERVVRDLLARPPSSRDNVDAYWLQKSAVAQVLASW